MAVVTVDRGLHLALRFLHTWRTAMPISDRMEYAELEDAIAAVELIRDKVAFSGEGEAPLAVEHNHEAAANRALHS